MLKQASNNPFGSWKIILLFILAGAVVLLISPVSAEKPYVSIIAKGDQSYHMGEKVIFSGMNTDSDSTYLFLTGPNLPDGGAKLSLPYQKTVSGDPGSFTMVKTKPDKTWEYTWYTYNGKLDAGSYTLYAVSKPETKDQFNDLTAFGTVSIIYKKPFLTGEISPSSVLQGQPFTVKGIAEGIPPHVQIWILGKNYHSKTIVSVNSDDASYKYEVPQEVSSHLASGQNFGIIQHPMQNNKFDIDVSGDYVKLNNGTNLFRINGPGSLQGSDAADALIAAISEREAHDATYTNDTYTIIPFQVTAPTSGGTGVTLAAQGDQSYYLGEKVVISGYNYDSDTTYLFMNGPGIANGGGKLTSPLLNVVSGNPDSFTMVKTKPDKIWEYVWYTANLPVDAGTYTLFAVSQPKAGDPLDPAAANVGIILKKPFITAEISPSSISPGLPFTASGFAEGNPETIQIWIFGKNSSSKSIVSVNSDASFKYVVPREVTRHFENGQTFMIVQHPMQNTTFDIDASGDYVKLNNGTNIFRISGPGSLQGEDAADALIAAFSDPNNGDDTYTETTFPVTDAGNPTPRVTTALTSPVPYGLLGDLEKALRSFFQQ